MKTVWMFIFSASVLVLNAQAPQAIKYQAVARDNAGALVANEPVAVRFSILDNSGSGSVLYQERHTPTTNDYGLFSLAIGTGTVLQGDFETIDWSAGARFLKVELDPEGGTNYFDMGSDQLLSVPYALYSQNSASAANATDAQTLTVSGNTLSISNGNSVTLPGGGGSYTAGSGINIAGSTISNTAPDQTVAITGTGATTVSGTYPNFTVNTPIPTDTDDQTLNLSGNTLSISEGNSVNLSSYLDNTDNQDLTSVKTGNSVTVSITNGTGTTFSIADSDSDPANELQSLLVSGNTLSISSGNSVTLPSGGGSYTAGTGIDLTGNVITNTAPDQPVSVTGAGITNVTGTYPNFTVTSTEVPQVLSLNGNNLSLTGGGGQVTLPSGSGSYTASNGVNIAANDIKLGGALTGNTDIPLGGYSLAFSGAGNVGIGTTPGYPLHVSASNATSAVVSSNTNAAGIGLSGQNTATAGTGAGIGVYGATQQANGFGVYGSNLNTNGTGIIGIGNNVSAYTLPAGGAGGAFFGGLTGAYGYSPGSAGYGVYGKADDAANSYGVVGIANGVGGVGPVGGAGGAFTGYNYGVAGSQTNITPNVQTAAGYFVGGANTGVQVTTLVEAFSTGNVHYKIWGSNPGSVSTCVPDLNGNMVTLHATETPEFYFQDYGQGKLENGRAHIDIDPILAKNVAISEKHPLRVFVQLEGDCNGVYVANKTTTGFDVVELNGGTSSVSFQWSITCNVADAMVGNRLSRFSDLRFEPGPVDMSRTFDEKR